MNNTVRQFLSGLIAGMIVMATSMIAIASDLPDGSSALSSITEVQWFVAVLGGVLAAMKDWKTLLAEPSI